MYAALDSLVDKLDRQLIKHKEKMKNQYKRTDIFRCVHDVHQKFQNRISVYHILKEKQCYPQGCFYFRWRCKQLNKKNKCYRGFFHVGRKCFGCRDFYDEKIPLTKAVEIMVELSNEYKNKRYGGGE